MARYLLSIYQPGGTLPPPDVLAPIMRDLAALEAELREAGAWVFSGGLHPPDTATVIRAPWGQCSRPMARSPRAKSTLVDSPVIDAPDLDARTRLGGSGWPGATTLADRGTPVPGRPETEAS